MKIEEAYKILEVSGDISDEELKKIYKDLARKYHPDRFKDDPNKFKVINEAYQLIVDYRANPEKYEPKMQPGAGFWGNISNIGDIFFGGGFTHHDEDDVRVPHQHIKLNLTISFHQSILGCQKEIQYQRAIKCSLCQGIGHKKTGNGCDKCDGFGRVTTNNRGMIFQSGCAKCHGQGVKKNKCDKCNGQKTLNEERVGNINIPAGSKNAETLRLIGEGNFAGRHMLGEAYTDVYVELKVEPYKNLSIQDQNVCSELTLSLLDALTGTTKEIETVYGNREIIIPGKSKHTDQIKIPQCGVKGSTGSHIVKLNIEYPEDVTKLIGVLQDVILN